MLKCRETLYTLHQPALICWILASNEGVESLHHSTPTLHPCIWLTYNDLNGIGVECRVFFDFFLHFTHHSSYSCPKVLIIKQVTPWWAPDDSSSLIRALIMFYMVDTLCINPQTWRVTSVFDFVWNFFRVMPRLSRKRIVSRLYLCRTSSEAFCTESSSVFARASASGSETSHNCHVCSILFSNCSSFLPSLQAKSKESRQSAI